MSKLRSSWGIEVGKRGVAWVSPRYPGFREFPRCRPVPPGTRADQPSYTTDLKVQAQDPNHFA
jgi:hypothetical protein